MTITNSGTGTLNITSITLTGTDPTQFTLGAPTSGTACPLGASTLNSGANCKVGLKFAPTTTGNKSANMSVADDATGSPQTVPLTGTGTTATVALTPSPVNFPNTRKGTISATLNVTLTNSGGADVHLNGGTPITIAGANAGDFAVVAPSVAGTPCAAGGTVVKSGGSCLIGVQFTPSTAAAETATLNVADDAVGSPQTDVLNGTGIFPAVTITPNPLAFGNQFVAAASAPLTATLKNTGTDTLNLAAANAVLLGGTNSGDFAIAAGTTCASSAVIAVNGTCLINVTFTPAVAGARSATITVTDDVAPAQVLNLTGTGDTPASVTATAGTPQSAAINAAFATALQATVKDAGGNVLAGVTVTFTAPSSGASGVFTGSGTATANVTTNASGVATAPTFTANGTAGGPYTVAATVSGVAAPANFSLTNLAGPAASITATAGTPQSVVINNAFAALKATVKDAGGNLVSGVTVTFTAPSTGASGTFAGGAATANVATDASGVATAPTFTANSAAGSYTVTATVPGVGTPANFQLSNLPGVPSITSLSPTSATAGGAAFTLTVNGTNFVATSVVNFNGAAKVTTFKTSTQLTAAITAADILSAGVVNVTVTTPAPGGGTSAAASFTINNVQPVLSTLSPTNTLAGGAAFTLTITGSGFVSGATVNFGNNPALTPSSIAATQIQVTVPAADIATAGNVLVTVTNPAPSVGPSVPATFTVNNPVPTVTNAAVSGKNHAAGGTAFTLTVTGTNFVSTSTVNFSGKAEPTTFVSATQVTAAIPASDVANAGNVNVTVTNPGPGGGTSTSPFAFTLDGFGVSAPATTTVKAGSQATITVTVTPTANGFTSTTPISFAVTGLPIRTTSAFNPATVVPGNATVTTTLTITTEANSAVPPSSPIDWPSSPVLRFLPVIWLAMLLAGLYAMSLIRRNPQRQLRRSAAIVPLALLLFTGAMLAACSGALRGTPTGPAPLKITATSGTLSQTANVTLTVQ